MNNDHRPRPPEPAIPALALSGVMQPALSLLTSLAVLGTGFAVASLLTGG